MSKLNVRLGGIVAAFFINLLFPSCAVVAQPKTYGNYLAMRYAVALKEGFASRIDQIVQRGADINSAVIDGVTVNPLIYSAQHLNDEAAMYLISKGADVNRADKDGNTALLWSINKNLDSVSTSLIETGANVNVVNRDGLNAVDTAIRSNAPFALVDLLLSKGAAVSDKSISYALKNGRMYSTARLLYDTYQKRGIKMEIDDYYRALLSDNVEAVERSLAKYSQTERGQKETESAFYAAALGYADILELLAKEGFDFIHCRAPFRTLLQTAVRNNQTKCVETLIRFGVDVNERGPGDQEPILIAIRNGNIGIVKLILDKGPIAYKINDNEFDNNVALYALCYGGFEMMNLLIAHGCSLQVIQGKRIPAAFLEQENASKKIEYLINKGFDINSYNQYRRTMLYFASFPSISENVFEWVATHSDLRIKFESGMDPLKVLIGGNADRMLFLFGLGYKVSDDNLLFEAVWKPDLSALKLLYQNRTNTSDINKILYNGKTLIYEASKMGYENIVSYLLEQKADINTIDELGETPLMIASRYNQFEVVQLLLKHGADRVRKNNVGKTAFDIAKEQGNSLVMDLLR